MCERVRREPILTAERADEKRPECAERLEEGKLQEPENSVRFKLHVLAISVPRSKLGPPFGKTLCQIYTWRRHCPETATLGLKIADKPITTGFE